MPLFQILEGSKWKMVTETYLNVLKFLMSVWFDKVMVGRPIVESKTSPLLFPSECRERGVSYKSNLQAVINYRFNKGSTVTEVKSLGHIPILVRV